MSCDSSFAYGTLTIKALSAKAIVATPYLLCILDWPATVWRRRSDILLVRLYIVDVCLMSLLDLAA